MRVTRGSSSRSASVFCAKMAPLAPVTPTVMVCVWAAVMEFARARTVWQRPGGKSSRAGETSPLPAMLDFRRKRGHFMKSTAPVDVVLAFMERINAADVDGLCALMTEDHLFVDGLGNRMQGREMMRQGWAGYFRMFPDYRVSHAEIFSQGDVVASFGTAEATYAVEGKLRKENHWSVPAAWRAVVRAGLIAEWQVYADNQAARKIMGWPNP